MYIHGCHRTRTYSIWENIKQRCLVKQCPNYKWYGARGIKVCDKWLKFEGFLEDMGHVPEGLEIDRIDNDGDYNKENCRWVTHRENCQHRRIGRFTDLTRLTFGRVTASTLSSTKGKTRWECFCSCGNHFVTRAGDLIQGKVKSCGCVRREKTILRNRSHSPMGGTQNANS